MIIDTFMPLRCLTVKDYDVIHAHLHEGVLVAWALNMIRRRRPIVFDCQGGLVKETQAHDWFQDDERHKFGSWLEKFTTSKAHHIITSTDQMRQALTRQMGIKTPVTTATDGVATRKPSPVALDLPTDQPIVDYLGGLQSRKGIDYLLKAVPDVDAHFLIMGYPGVSRCQQMLRELGCLDKTSFTGAVNYFQMFDYLALGDVAVSPKVLQTGEANAKLLAYMAAGLPTVCFDDPANRLLLGDLGSYAQPNPGDLASKISELLANSHRKKIGAQLRKRAQKYSWANTARKIDSIYQHLS